jgi:hypothetical protein
LGILGQALGQMGGQQQQQQALNQGTQAAMGLLNRPAAQIPQVDPLQLRQMLEMYFG